MQERTARRLSVRAASLLGGITNTTWGEWEKGVRPAGLALQRAVAVAFGWPADWMDRLDELPTTTLVQSGAGGAGVTEQRLTALERRYAELAARLDALESNPGRPGRPALTPLPGGRKAAHERTRHRGIDEVPEQPEDFA
jgi:hypothetical protein